jgi:hypothetical protein
MRTSKRQISSITGVLSHFGLRKANGDIGVVAGVRDLPGIADNFGKSPRGSNSTLKTEEITNFHL